MSTISLNNIKINQSAESDLFRICGVINSESGLYEPRVIRSIQDLTSYYGEFKYSDQYAAFIDAGIPVVLLNLNSYYQKYNNSSLRVYRYRDEITVNANPKLNSSEFISYYISRYLGFSYKYLTDILNQDYKSYATIVEIPADISNLSYFIINYGIESDSNKAYKVIYRYEKFYSSTINYSKEIILKSNGVEARDVNSITSCIKFSETNPSNTYPSYTEYNPIQSIDSLPVLNLKQILEMVIYGAKDYTAANHKGINTVNSYWVDESTESYICELLIKAHYYLIDSNEASLEIIKLIKSMMADARVNELDDIDWENLIDSVYQLFGGDDFNKFIIFNPNSVPSSKEFHDFKLSECSELNSDIILTQSELTKVLDIYSKSYGPVGNDISIEFNKTQYDGIYELNVNNGTIFESFNFYIIRPNSDVSALSVSEVNESSKLIQLTAYTYKVPNDLGYFDLVDIVDTDIDSYNYEFDLTYYNYDRESSHFIDKVINYFKLPEGSYRLDGAKSYKNNLFNLLDIIQRFSELKLYPDLVLVDELPSELKYYNYDELINLLKELVNADRSSEYNILNNYSQLLINLKPKDLVSDYKLRKFTEPKSNIIYSNEANDNTNRIIYTYEDCYISEKLYSLNYLYALDIINSSYLSNNFTELYYNPFEIKLDKDVVIKISNTDYKVELIKLIGTDKVKLNDSVINLTDLNNQLEDIRNYLISQQVNLLNYNNLEYYYTKLFEPFNQHSVFVIRYLTSKVSRELLKHHNRLLGVTKSELMNILDSITHRIKSSSDLYQQVTYKYEMNNNTIKLKFDIRIVGLTNKHYYVTYILNIK